MMDKKMIERAFQAIVDKYMADSFSYEVCEFAAVIAEQAIAIECEVEHMQVGREKITIAVKQMGNIKKTWLFLDKGHHGTPGKAIAIIVSLGDGEE